jgi:hypothetical protein
MMGARWVGAVAAPINGVEPVEPDGCRMRVVAMDGYPQHSTPLQIALSDSYLDPKGIEKPGPQCAA